jgi:hypothetical protein
MDFNELLHKLEGVRVINRQLADKLEEARQRAAVYKEFHNAESNSNRTSNQSSNVGSHYRLYTMDFVKDQNTIRAAIDILNVYDGIQFLISEDEQALAILKFGQITRNGKIPGKTFTTRRNSKGVIVWRID